MDCSINISGISANKAGLNNFGKRVRTASESIAKKIAYDICNETIAGYTAAASVIASTEEAKDPTKWTTRETVPFSVRVQVYSGYIIRADVIGTNGASWLEFGTGVKKNIASPHPELFMPYGTYGSMQGSTGHSWIYAKGKRSYGYKASCAMYNATEKARANLSSYTTGVL